MSRKSGFSQFALVATSFVTGIAAGLLLAPKSGRNNRKWVGKNISGLAEWADQKSRMAKNGLKKEIDQNVPDLYRATEHIPLNESDVLGV